MPYPPYPLVPYPVAAPGPQVTLYYLKSPRHPSPALVSWYARTQMASRYAPCSLCNVVHTAWLTSTAEGLHTLAISDRPLQMFHAAAQLMPVPPHLAAQHPVCFQGSLADMYFTPPQAVWTVPPPAIPLPITALGGARAPASAAAGTRPAEVARYTLQVAVLRRALVPGPAPQASAYPWPTAPMYGPAPQVNAGPSQAVQREPAPPAQRDPAPPAERKHAPPGQRELASTAQRVLTLPVERVSTPPAQRGSPPSQVNQAGTPPRSPPRRVRKKRKRAASPPVTIPPVQQNAEAEPVASGSGNAVASPSTSSVREVASSSRTDDEHKNDYPAFGVPHLLMEPTESRREETSRPEPGPEPQPQLQAESSGPSAPSGANPAIPDPETEGLIPEPELEATPATSASTDPPRDPAPPVYKPWPLGPDYYARKLATAINGIFLAEEPSPGVLRDGANRLDKAIPQFEKHKDIITCEEILRTELYQRLQRLVIAGQNDKSVLHEASKKAAALLAHFRERFPDIEALVAASVHIAQAQG